MTDKTPYKRVPVAPGSRLEQLYAQYDELERAAKDAETRFETVKDAIKAELGQAAPDATAISADCATVGLTLELTYGESWRLDSKRLKAEDPGTYVKYAKASGSWTLKRARS